MNIIQISTSCLLSLSIGMSAMAATPFTIGSNDIAPGATIADEFVFGDCKGGNVSPELHWSGAPKGTKSFALTMYDPDAPTGSGFWHWIVYNIPASVTSLPKGWKNDGRAIEFPSDWGVAPYGGPCPPPGKPHAYVFTIHALNTDKLDVSAGATNAIVRFMIEAATIKKAKFKAFYGTK